MGSSERAHLCEHHCPCKTAIIQASPPARASPPLQDRHHLSNHTCVSIIVLARPPSSERAHLREHHRPCKTAIIQAITPAQASHASKDRHHPSKPTYASTTCILRAALQTIQNVSRGNSTVI